MQSRIPVGLALAVSLLLALAPGAHAEHGAAAPSLDMEHLANSPNPGTTNTDIAFWNELAFSGYSRGFRILDIGNPNEPKVLSNFRCNGSQSDMGVYGYGSRLLLFQSVDARQSSSGCGISNFALGWEGIRIFDVSDTRNPVHVKSVTTDCGSHTHTVVPDPNLRKRNERVFLYVSSYPLQDQGPHTHDDPDGAEGPGCFPAHHKISVIEVPLERPQRA